MNTLNYFEDCKKYFEEVLYLPSRNYDYYIESKIKDFLFIMYHLLLKIYYLKMLLFLL